MKSSVTIKSILICVSLILFALPVVCQTYGTYDNIEKNWSDLTAWKTPGIPNLNSSSCHITIEGYITHVGNLIFKKEAVLHIIDTLVVTGNLDLAKDGQVTISSGGLLIVLGSYSSKKATEIDNGGILVVVGEFEMAKDSQIDNSGGIYLYDDNPSYGGSPINGNEISDEDDLEEIHPGISDFIEDPINYPLPIVLFSFTGVKTVKGFILSFSTLSEQNFDYFSIERSADAKNYVSIGTVKGSGYSAEKKDYSFVDLDPLPGMNYYRLKAVDYDGYTEYFPAISVYNDFTDVKAQTMISDYTLRIQNNIDCTARLTSLSGTGVFDVDLRAGTNELILPASLPKGIYALIILSGDNVVKRERVFVQ